MITLLIQGLLLPFRLYFQPSAFADEVAALAPDLPREYSLWQARHKLRDAPQFRQAVARLAAHSMIAVLWALLIAFACSLVGIEVDWLNVAFGVALGVALGVAFGVALGVAFGVAVGVALGVAVGVAFGVAAFLSVTHLWIWPVQVCLSTASWVVKRVVPNWGPRLWRLSPVRWDEIILLPLPGLSELLVALTQQSPKLGQEALAVTAAHAYQHRAATDALLRLAQDEAAGIASLAGIASFHRSLGWFNEESKLPPGTTATLSEMRDLSQEVASANDADSASNQLRRMMAAQEKAANLQLRGGPFGNALRHWSALLEQGIEEAERRLRDEEPIPNVYMGDGSPLYPMHRETVAATFKGRRSFFQRMEGALGGGHHERATYVLYGQRRSGKSSAMMQLPARLGSTVVPTFVDLQNASNAEGALGFLESVARGIREEARLNRGLHLPPLTRDDLAGDPYLYFGQWLDRVEQALGDRYLLLALDEFERIEESIAKGRLDHRFLNLLRHTVQHRRKIAVLLAGSHQLGELPPHWADTLISAATLEISFLDESDARELIVQPVADFPADLYQPDAVDELLRLTHCQPYFIQVLCSELVMRMNAQHRQPPESRITIDDVAAVLPEALHRASQHLIDLWASQTGSDLARAILHRMAAQPNDWLPRDVLRDLANDSELRAAVATLLRREIIVPDGEGYRIVIPFVAEYVRRRDWLF